MTRPPSQRFRPRSSGRRKPARRNGHDDHVLLYGLHTVEAALANPRRRKRRLLATRNALARLRDRGAALDVAIEETTVKEIDRRLAGDAVHQGVLLEADPLPLLTGAELAGARLVLALDQTTDPHNVGAILRSAAAFAADAVIVPRRHSAAETGALAKAASGALDIVPLVSVGNLSDALEDLGAAGLARVGLDSAGTVRLEDALPDGPVVIVLGSEGKGLRQRTRATCDILARLDMPGAIKSLNVSNAAALALYIARSRAAGGS